MEVAALRMFPSEPRQVVRARRLIPVASGWQQKMGRPQASGGEIRETSKYPSVRLFSFTRCYFWLMYRLPLLRFVLWAIGCRLSQGVGTSTPQIKVGEDVYRGKTEPIVGTTMTFVTPKAGSSGGGSVGVCVWGDCLCVCPFALAALAGCARSHWPRWPATDRLLDVKNVQGYS